jgi:hypothetical protein
LNEKLAERIENMPVKFTYIIVVIFMMSAIVFGFNCDDDGVNYENLSPNRPFSPWPADGAQDQALDTQLSWRCSDPDGDPLIYDIFFGSAMNPPEAATGLSDTTYNPGMLDSNTTYYWKIVAHDPRISRSGPVWNFATGTE